MDITDRRTDPLPAAGKLRFVNDEGKARILDSNGRRTRVRPEVGTPVNAVAATLSTNLAGANNDLVFTAQVAGVAGNSISIAYVDPGVETASETVAVSGRSITVTLRSVSSVLSTATQVKAAIEANASAVALVSVANKAANDGTGSVIAMAAAVLASGVDATEGQAGDMLVDGTSIYMATAEVTKASTSGWRKVAHYELNSEL
jgi:hypothetical protein